MKYKKEDKVEELVELSVQADYLPEWKKWEGFREIVQNAKDAGGVKVNKRKGYIEIKDDGEGFDKKALLIGYTTKAKDNKTIGKFGEGLKFGSLALIREGSKVEIFSRGRKYAPVIVYSKGFDEKVLAFKVSDDGEIDKGTVVRIWRFGNLYKKYKRKIRFLVKKEYKEEGEILLDEKDKGNVYAKGIFVYKDDKLKYGYDFSELQVDRDRSMPATYDLNRQIGLLWLKQDDEIMVSRLFESLVSIEAKESEMIVYNFDLDEKKIELWKRVWKAMFGDNAVVETDVNLRDELEYYGYKGIRVKSGISEAIGIIAGTDVEVLKARREVAWEDLGDMYLYDFPTLFEAVGILGFNGKLRWFRGKQYKDMKVLGFLKDMKDIYINVEVISEYKMIEILIHEFTHWQGFTDNTPDFLQAYSYNWIKVFKWFMEDIDKGLEREDK